MVDTDIRYCWRAEFQSICTGEYVTVAKKHKTATGIKWRVPGIMGGNAVPGWEDQQGSIVRRIVLFSFVKAVENVDTTIPDKLSAEMPRLLVKCNRAYLEAVEEVGTRSIWARNILPQYFHTTKDEMSQIVNSMRGFLSSKDLVKTSPDLYCPLSEVKAAYFDFVRDHNIRPVPRWTPDLYKGPLEAKGLRLRTMTKEYPQQSGVRKRGDFVMGMDLIRNMKDDGEEQDDDEDGNQDGDQENRDPNHVSVGRR